MLMYSEIKVINEEHTEFNLGRLRVKTKFKLIVFNCVYDNFSDSYDWMDEYDSEGTLIIFWETLNPTAWDQSWIDRLNKKVKNRNFRFLYLTGSDCEERLQKYFNAEFNVKYFTAHDIKLVESWSRDQGLENTITGPLDINIHKYKQFSYLNKTDTIQQRYVLSRLNQSNLIHNGSISYPTLEHDVFNKIVGFTDASIEYIKMQCSSTPIVPNDSTWFRDKHFQTYVNIATNTENIFKAFGSNQIFFTLGERGSLASLKRLGYRTFDTIIDESYDDVGVDQERLFTATRTIVSFLNRPEEEISNDYKKVIPIIEHNRDLLFKQTLKYKMQNFFDEIFI